METCFVIQPFDKDKFDRRYTDSFEKAILAANLKPYRVDRDPSVRIPMEQIESGIKTSKICFAEITTDNPNIWYELGYAFACGKDVVMITEERSKFPFDIQHRHVITYNTKSKSDYEKLEKDITERLIALLGKQTTFKQLIENPVKESDELSQKELTMLLIILGNQLTPEESVSLFTLNSDMDKAGFNSKATSVSIRELIKKGYIELSKDSDYNGDDYFICRLSDLGESWILSNQDKIEFRTSSATKTQFQGIDDLPF